MNAPMDPMSQYDPATEALITQQHSPRQRVAHALMQQQPGGGLGGLSPGLMQLARMYGNTPRDNPNAHPYDPVMNSGQGGPVAPSPMDQASSLSTMQKPWYSGYLQPGGGT